MGTLRDPAWINPLATPQPDACCYKVRYAGLLQSNLIQRSIAFIGQYVQITVGPLPHITNALVKLPHQPFFVNDPVAIELQPD